MTDPHPGDRVVLIETSDPYTDLQPGTEGVVRLIDEVGFIHVEWEDGTDLALSPLRDEFEAV